MELCHRRIRELNNGISSKSARFKRADLYILHKKMDATSWLCELNGVYKFFIICISCENDYKTAEFDGISQHCYSRGVGIGPVPEHPGEKIRSIPEKRSGASRRKDPELPGEKIRSIPEKRSGASRRKDPEHPGKDSGTFRKKHSGSGPEIFPEHPGKAFSEGLNGDAAVIMVISTRMRGGEETNYV